MSDNAISTADLQFPQLRNDLQIDRHDTAEGTVYQIQDLCSGRFYRFRAMEHAIARLCDGQRSVMQICRQVSEELQTTLTTEVIEPFLTQLRKLGLLVGSDSAPTRNVPRRVQGSLLHLRVRLWNPDRTFQSLTGPLAFLFTPTFLVVSLCVLLAAAGVAITHREALVVDLSRLVELRFIVPSLLVFAGVIFLHECAHGLTCRHFGGSVRDMGFLLIYFLPAFYCDVSGAWGFTKKSQRLWVTFAGVWCNLLLWALSIFVWRVTQVDSGVHTVALLTMGLAGADTFFNLLPLIKLDGYYLLSDAVDAPNLRQNAFTSLGRTIKQFFGGAVQRQNRLSARQRAIYTVYGFAASLFSATLLCLIILKLGEFLMSRYQAFGFVMFLGMLSVMFSRPLMALFRSPLKVAGAPFRVFGERAWIARIVFSVAAPVIGVLQCPWTLSVIGDVEIQAADECAVRAEADGLVAEVFVTEGDVVALGQPLARLSNPARESQLREIAAQIAEKAALLSLLQAGSRPEQIAVAEAAVATAQTRLEHARRQLAEAEALRAEQLHMILAEAEKAGSVLALASEGYERQQLLLEQGATSMAECERRRSALEAAQADVAATSARTRLHEADRAAALVAEVADAESELHAAKLEVELLQAGPRSEELLAMQAEIDGLHAQRELLEQLAAHETIVSPIAGVVTTADLHDLRLRHVQQGDLLLTVQAFNTVRVEMSVSERELGDVRVGQEVSLKVLAYPDQCFSGEVTAVAPMATLPSEDTGVSRQFIVTTLVDNSNGLLRPGMTGNSKIRCGESSVFGVTLRKLQQSVSVEFWSWW